MEWALPFGFGYVALLSGTIGALLHKKYASCGAMPTHTVGSRRPGGSGTSDSRRGALTHARVGGQPSHSF
jgi:hypothetical protein